MIALPEALRTGQVANLLGVSESAVRTWIKLGKLPSFKVGSRHRIRPEDVQAFLDAGQPKQTAA